MKKYLTKILAIIFHVMVCTSCGKADIVQALPTVEKQDTPTITIAPTPIVTPTATPTPTVTPFPTTPAQATIEAFGALCIGAKEITSSEISPNGKWIAALCYNENEKEESPLQVVSLDHSEEWKIYYRDYEKAGHTGDRHDGIMPYRWSKDGRFLYAVAGSRLSGCCWIGGKYVLLIRLNLETGEQTEIINGTDFASDLPFSFTISENDRFLLSTPLTNQSYDFTVLDLQSWEKQVVTIKLEVPRNIDLEYAKVSPYEEIIVLPFFEHLEFNNFKVDSLGMINMTTGKQTLLVSTLKPEESLFLVQWIDKEHVLISNANSEYWSINIYTGERQRIDKP